MKYIATKKTSSIRFCQIYFDYEDDLYIRFTEIRFNNNLQNIKMNSSTNNQQTINDFLNLTKQGTSFNLTCHPNRDKIWIMKINKKTYYYGVTMELDTLYIKKN